MHVPNRYRQGLSIGLTEGLESGARPVQSVGVFLRKTLMDKIILLMMMMMMVMMMMTMMTMMMTMMKMMIMMMMIHQSMHWLLEWMDYCSCGRRLGRIWMDQQFTPGLARKHSFGRVTRENEKERIRDEKEKGTLHTSSSRPCRYDRLLQLTLVCFMRPRCVPTCSLPVSVNPGAVLPRRCPQPWSVMLQE